MQEENFEDRGKERKKYDKNRANVIERETGIN
jgi:hypothetical protein